MTVPTSKLLKANKSLIATASLKHMSPSYENSQQQSVSIVVNNSTPDLLKANTEESEDTCTQHKYVDKNNVNQTEDTNDVCSLRGTKALLRHHQGQAIRDAMKAEEAVLIERLQSDEAREACQAFEEGRKPDFSACSH